MQTHAQTRTCPAGISTHLCRSLSHFYYHNDSDSDSVCKTVGNFLSVSQSVSQSVIESVLSNEIHIKVRHMAKVWLTHTHTLTHIYTASSVYIDSALMLRNANARVSISNKAERNTPCVRTIAATAAIKVSSVYCQTICMLQTTRGGREEVVYAVWGEGRCCRDAHVAGPFKQCAWCLLCLGLRFAIVSPASQPLFDCRCVYVCVRVSFRL